MPSMFSPTLNSALDGVVLKPLLDAYLFDAEWPEVTVTFEKGKGARKPDGWFHPSEHPTWPDRMLWYLITQPDSMIGEKMERKNTLSVTMGTAVHTFIEACLSDIGVLVGPNKLTEMGFDVNPKNGEPSVADPETGARGHMDGVLDLFLPKYPKPKYHLFELKTSNERALNSIEDLDLEGFMRKWPGYYAQAQEYLRMTGFSVSVVLFMQMGFPWTLREFHIPANLQYQVDVKGKYLRVREAAKSDIMPPACCAIGSAQSKSCPARGVCPQGAR